MTANVIAAVIGLVVIVIGVLRLVRRDPIWGIVLVLVGLAFGGGGFLPG